MLIRSQNKCRLINFDSLPAIEIMEIEGDVRVICSDTYETFNIGKYSSEKKALKVLDMIEGAYADEKVIRYTLALQEREFKNMTRDQLLLVREGILEKAVFQMPGESDVRE